MKTLFATFVVLVGAFTASSALAACDDPPRPNVKWINCDKEGEDFTNADLTNASMLGVNLSRADLSGADLNGANLTGVNLSNVDLSGVIWTDGRRCADFSIGVCRTDPLPQQETPSSGSSNPETQSAPSTSTSTPSAPSAPSGPGNS